MKYQIASLGLAVSVSLAGSPFSNAAEMPLQEGTYFAPMASYIHAVNKTQLDDGVGGVMSVGFRNGSYAFEAGALYSSISTSDKNASFLGGVINGLLFPLKSLPGLYATIGVSGIELEDYPTVAGSSFSTLAVDGGLGYIFPLQVGNYEFGIRAEGRYRHAHRETRRNSARLDLDAPNNFDDMLINIGLQMPWGSKDAPPPPEPAAAVVAPETPADTDGDGVIDTLDQCPGSPAGDRVDAAGCTANAGH